MKKLISILAFLMVAVIATAQDYTFSYGGTAGIINATVQSTTVTTPATAVGMKSAAYSYVFKIPMPSPYYYTYSIRLQGMAKTNVAANHYASVKVYGALENASGSYAQIGSTVACHVTSNDTCWTSQITSAPLSWRYFKFLITPYTSDTVWVEHILLNVAPLLQINPASVTPGR
jgi:hypothetical protein